MDKNDKTKDKREEVNKEVEELKKRIEELENNWKRALADYQNLEKRVAEERKEWMLKANKELLLHLLPVLDTLMQAAKHSKDEGLTLSVKQFLDTLKQEGLERIGTVGKIFDPELMECVDTGEGEEGKVLEEVRTGYKYITNGTILRTSLVKVGKKIQEKQEEEKAKKELQKGDYM